MEEFKLIVAGSRSWDDYGALVFEINQLAYGELNDYAVSIVSGMARGADAMGARFAKDNNIVLYEFPADWDAFGKRAGFVRNAQMADFADGLLAFWDGQSRGTKHMIETMTAYDKRVWVANY